MFKSQTEIALMQVANDITLESFRAATSMLEKGMTQYDFGGIISKAHSKMGASGGALVSFGKSSAFPHGSKAPQQLQEGDIVMMDGGCRVEGYSSDITRTIVFGEQPNANAKFGNLKSSASCRICCR